MLIFEMFVTYTCGDLKYLVGNDGSVTWKSSLVRNVDLGVI